MTLWLGETKFYKAWKTKGVVKGGIDELVEDLKKHITKDYLSEQYVIIKRGLETQLEHPQREEWIEKLSRPILLKDVFQYIRIPLLCIYEDDIALDYLKAIDDVQLTEDLETRFMAAVKRMKQAFNLCSSSDAISDEEKDYLHFYCAVRSILFKLTKGDAPDISQMNARVRELLEGAIQSDGIEELFETGKHISVDIFSDEYLDRINAIQLPNTKIKVLQRLLSRAIDEYKKVNRIMGMEFSDRLKRVVDEYNNRRRDEAFANEVLDDVAEQLAKLLEELKKEKDSFKGMGIDYEEKAFYDILKAVAKKYEFEYPDDKMIELSKRIKIIVDDKAKYTDWSTRDDIKANLQVDLILLLDEFDYPPVTIDDVYKEVLEQAENFKKYAG